MFEEKATLSSKKQRPSQVGAANSSTPSTHNKPLGGLFSPLAQYPGAGYAEVFATARSEPPIAEHKPAQVAHKTIVRTKNTMAHVPDHFFTSALLLVDDEGNARMDKNTLREAGIGKIQVLTSGLLAARFLSHYAKEIDAKHIDIIVCHPHLGDMSALQWIELMRLHPVLKHLPVLGIAGSEDTAKLLRAFGGGFTEILVRPYSQDDLRRILYKMQEITLAAQSQRQSQSEYGQREQAEKDNAIFAKGLKRLESFQSEGGRAESFVQDGLQWLKIQEWDKAITTLNKALYSQEMRGEAEYGLAVAWQGKKNVEKYCYYLSEACVSLVRSQKWAKARMAYTQLLKVMPKAANPFVIVAEALVRAQKYREAEGTLVLGLPLGNAQDTTERLARACYYSDDPSFALEKIQKSFTAPLLHPIVQALSEALKKVGEEHEQRLQKRREERAALREKSRSLPAMAFTEERTASRTAQPGVMLSLDDPFDAPFDPVDEERNASTKMSKKGKKQTGWDDAEALDDISSASALSGVEGHTAKKDARQKTGKNSDTHAKQKSGSKTSHNANAIAPLQPLFEEDVAVNMFSPKLNDIATVIKTTWKIMKGK